MAVTRRHVPEVPLDPTNSGQLRRFLVDMREVVHSLVTPVQTAQAPSNLMPTAQAFAVLLQWTRGANAVGTEVLWNSTPTLNGAAIVDVGNSAQWTDYVGKNGITRFYWVRSYGVDNKRSIETGPVSATTLASGTAVAPPVPPIASQQMALDTTRGYVVPKHPLRG